MKYAAAEIIGEYGPFPGIDNVHGVSFDGRQLWFASGNRLNALDPETGRIVRSLDVAANAGTAFDGKHLFQITEAVIQKIDPTTGEVLAWAEGTLWVGQHRGRRIHQVDPETGTVLRTIESDRFVTGVTWTNGELWHGTWENETSDIRRIDPETGKVLERLEMPEGKGVSGLEADAGERFFCGGGSSGKVRVVHRPERTRSGGTG